MTESTLVKILRYETIRPTLNRDNLKYWWDTKIPTMSSRARILRVESDGRVLILDRGVPDPVLDLEEGTADWGNSFLVDIRAVLHFDTRVITLPEEPGRYLGQIKNETGTWSVFELCPRRPEDASPARPDEPSRTRQSATASDQRPVRASAPPQGPKPAF